jgi:iron complex transport system ATP-binding protein
MLQAEGLDFSYGTRSVLEDISFRAEENNIISILGPNGVGKTTLLKCMCNIHRPQRGSISLDGKDILKLSTREMAKCIGYVPQSAPPSRMTVFDSVLIGRRPYIDLNATREDLQKTSEAIAALGLSDISLKYVNEISGGEYQKVHLARALVQEPQVLILDEPTNNLDISNAHLTMHMIFETVRQHGVSTIMTMHDINLAVHFSDRFLFMKNGRIKAYGDRGIITKELIEDVYGIKVDVMMHNGIPFVIPLWDQPGFVKHTHTRTDNPSQSLP